MFIYWLCYQHDTASKFTTTLLKCSKCSWWRHHPCCRPPDERLVVPDSMGLAPTSGTTCWVLGSSSRDTLKYCARRSLAVSRLRRYLEYHDNTKLNTNVKYRMLFADDPLQIPVSWCRPTQTRGGVMLYTLKRD